MNATKFCLLVMISVFSFGLSASETVEQRIEKSPSEKFGAIDLAANEKAGSISLDISLKSDWKQEWTKTSEAVSKLKEGDFGRFCMTANKDGYAKLWLIDPDQSPSVIAPNEFTKGKPYVTKSNIALKVEKDKPLCIGEEMKGAMQIQSDSKKGYYRVVGQWKASVDQLYSESDFANLTRSISTSEEIAESDEKIEDAQNVIKSSLKQNSADTFVYRVVK